MITLVKKSWVTEHEKAMVLNRTEEIFKTISFQEVNKDRSWLLVDSQLELHLSRCHLDLFLEGCFPWHMLWWIATVNTTHLLSAPVLKDSTTGSGEMSCCCIESVMLLKVAQEGLCLMCP